VVYVVKRLALGVILITLAIGILLFSDWFAKSDAVEFFECREMWQRVLRIQGTFEPVRNSVWLARSAASHLRSA